MKRICKNCDWREGRLCGNCDKLHEEGATDDKENVNDDHLGYTYNESGSFEVGDNFGCVHFKKKVPVKQEDIDKEEERTRFYFKHLIVSLADANKEPEVMHSFYELKEYLANRYYLHPNAVIRVAECRTVKMAYWKYSVAINSSVVGFTNKLMGQNT